MNKNLIQEILSAKYLFQYERGRVISEQKKVNLSESVLKNVLSEQSDMATKLTTFSEDDKKGPDEVGITWTPISEDDFNKLENATGNYVYDVDGFKKYTSLVNNKREGYQYYVNTDGTWIKCPYKNGKYGGICVYKNDQGAYVKGYCGKNSNGGADQNKFRGVGTSKYDGKTQEQLDTLTKRHYEKLNTEIKQNPATEMNPDALKVGDRGEKVKELQQRLIDKGVTDPKTGKVIIKDGKFGPATQRTLEKFEAEVNKPVDVQTPKLATVEQYPCLTDDNKSKWGKSIFYANGKALLQGGYLTVQEKQFSCGEDGNILVNGIKISNTLPKFSQVVEKGMGSEFIDENKKYKLEKRPTGEDQVSAPIVIDYNINKTLFVFVAWVYETISEDEIKFIYLYSDGTAEALKKGADYLSDKASSVEKTGTFEYDGTNLTFSWGNPEETTETQTFPFASQEEYTQFKEWMKKSNPTVYTDMGGTGEPNEWNSVMAKVYEKLKTDWETYKQRLVQTVVSETKKEWFYQDENKKVTGPFTKDELLETINSNPSALVWRKKMSAWTKAGNIRSLGLSDDVREVPPPVRTRNQNLGGTVGYPITTKDKAPPPTRQQ